MYSYPKPKRAAWLLADFKRFCTVTRILDKIESQPHDEMMEEMARCIPDFSAQQQTRELYLAPRYSYKTSIAKALIVYLILRFPDISISIYRASRLLAKDMLAAIQEILQRNPEILSTFGDVSSGAPLWTTFKFTVNTRTRAGILDPTVAAFGLKTSMTGTHPDFVLMDDLVTDINCDSIVEMQKAEKLVESAYPVLPKWGVLLITGTQWSRIDVYWKIREKNKTLVEDGHETDFREYIRKVYTRDENGDLVYFFPRDLHEEFLEQQRLTVSPRWFASWYFQEVHELGMAPFPKDKIKIFEGEYIRGPYKALQLQGDRGLIPLFVVLVMDPALTAAASSDNFGLNVVGFDPDKNWWVLESQEFRKLPSQATRDVIDLLRKYEPDCFLVEPAAADLEMMNQLRDFIRGSGMPTMIRDYNAIRDEPHGRQGKDARILALEHKVHGEKIRFRKGMCGAVIREMDNYPSLDHDDCLDALAMCRKMEKMAPRERTFAVKEDDREPVDLFHQRLDEAEIRPPGFNAPAGGVARGSWTGPLTPRS
jgi:phage terminase large subunit-like protein